MDTSRIKNALWGAFIADSIAMPAHWYYRRKYIQLDERYHYHHDLKKGENTLGANLLRVLMRSVTKKEEYNQEKFIEEFVKYMTTPGLNKDPYSEVYVKEHGLTTLLMVYLLMPVHRSKEMYGL